MLQDVEARRHDGDRLPERRYRPLRARARGADAAERSDLGTRERGGGSRGSSRRADVHRPAAGRDRAALPARPRGGGARRPRRRDRVRQRVHRLRGRGHVPQRLRDRPPLRLRRCCRSTATRRSSSRARRATSASTARRGSTSRSSSTAPATGSPTQVRGKRVGVYGLDYVMTVRDYAALDGAAELVALGRRVRPRAHGQVASSSSRPCATRVRINTEGFWIFLEHFEPGKTEREVLAPCEEYFVAQGCGRWTMDMVLDGPNGAALPEFKIAGARGFGATDCVLPSLEVAGPGRPLGRGLARDLPRRAERRHEADARGLRGVLRRPRPRRSAPARPRATPTAPSRRASSTAASTSATSPATRSG